MKGRTTTDVLILLVAGTICFAILATGAAVAALNIARPGVDTSTSQKTISDAVNLLIGILAGFLAGKTQQTQEKGASGEPPEQGDQ
jgi:hypothetical protein